MKNLLDYRRRTRDRPPRDVFPKGLRIAQTAVKIEYGGLIVLGIVWPIGNLIFNQSAGDMPVGIMLTVFVLVFFGMAKFGLLMMESALQTLPPMLVRQWALVATCLGPFSCIGYAILLDTLRHYGFKNEFLSLTGTILGFYMPFILLTAWLKYKCRTDEF